MTFALTFALAFLGFAGRFGFGFFEPGTFAITRIYLGIVVHEANESCECLVKV